MHPLVTIVTPSFNQGRFLCATIESVLNQDYSPVEYLIFDGGSEDRTIEILQKYGDRLFWVSEKDRGQSHAINKGWMRARGEILAWLNSDDVYLPGAISKAVSFLQNHPEIDAMYGEGYHIDEEGRVIERYPTEPFDHERLREICFICQPTVFIRKRVLERVGYLDENLRYCMDYDFWFRIARAFNFGYIPEYIACTRFHKETKTLGEKFPVHREILEMVHRHFGSVPPSWVYGYCRASLERYLHPSKPWSNFLFAAGLVVLSIQKFWQYNYRTPISQCRYWGRWLYRNFAWDLLWNPTRK
jgi:glycosyltransferase involved in cell wall biosynthesis